MKHLLISGILIFLLQNLGHAQLFKTTERVAGAKELKTSFFDEEGNLKHRTHSFFDDKGRMIKQNTFQGETLSNTSIYEYNEQDDLIMQSQEVGGETVGQIQYLYEYKDDKIFKQRIKYEGGFVINFEAMPSVDPKSITYLQSTPDGKQNKIWTLLYDEDNQLIESSSLDPKNGSVEKTIFEYNKKGDRISKKVDRQEKQDYTVVYLGDENDNQQQFEFKYDGKKRKIEQFIIKGKQKLLMATFDYVD